MLFEYNIKLCNTYISLAKRKLVHRIRGRGRGRYAWSVEGECPSRFGVKMSEVKFMSVNSFTSHICISFNCTSGMFTSDVLRLAFITSDIFTWHPLPQYEHEDLIVTC